MEDAQPEKHAPHVALLARLDALQEVAGGLLAHAFQARHLCECEVIKARYVRHKSSFYELPDEDFAATLDVHRAARAPMFEAPAHLRRAIRVHAAPDDALVAFNLAGSARDL